MVLKENQTLTMNQVVAVPVALPRVDQGAAEVGN